MEITSVEQAKDAIKKWLNENHHQVSEIEDENAHFHFEIDYPIGTQKRQRIIQPKEYPGLIVLLNGVSLAPEHIEKLKKIKEEKREEFYAEIRKDLIFAENSYDMNLDEDGIVKQVQFSYEFYFDGLKKTNLFRGLLLNHRALLYIVSKFNERFGVPTLPTMPVEQAVPGHA